MEKVQPSTAKDVFLYLLMIITLYVGVFSLLALLFQYVNYQFPDPLEWYYRDLFDAIRVSISCLVVVWPVYILTSRAINQGLREDKDKQDMWVRKWLLYLTLFIAAGTVIVDLIVLINSFLGGELTARFALKVAAVLLVSLSVLWYYRWELIRKGTQKTTIPFTAAIVSSVFIIGWIIAGFFLVGTPKTQRAVRMDETRIQSLSQIQYDIMSYWQQTEMLPASLSDVEKKLGYVLPKDPLSAEAYEYRVLEGLSFELCANFEKEVPAAKGRTTTYTPYGATTSVDWQHGVGRTCFTRIVDTAMYPSIK